MLCLYAGVKKPSTWLSDKNFRSKYSLASFINSHYFWLKERQGDKKQNSNVLLYLFSGELPLLDACCGWKKGRIHREISLTLPWISVYHIPLSCPSEWRINSVATSSRSLILCRFLVPLLFYLCKLALVTLVVSLCLWSAIYSF